MLKAVDIHKSYGTLEVLKGVSLEIKKGEIASIVGASGAGKSTLLHVLGTLDLPDKGEVFINNVPLHQSNDKLLAKFRNRHIGFIFQFHHLLPEFTAEENVAIPAMINKVPKSPALNKARELLAMLSLHNRLNHKPSELSGGEQQRVAVARALVNNPDVVMADEPSGNLDSDNSKELHQLFFELRRKLNQTFVIVTHNAELADMADRKLVMRDGIIE